MCTILEEVRAEGRKENARDIACRLLAKNYPVQEIAEVTALPLEEVEELKAQMSNNRASYENPRFHL